MVTKNQIKLIQSLVKKKCRDEEHLFVAEGLKLVSDILPYFEAVTIFSLPDYMAELKECGAAAVETATHDEIKRISLLQASQGVVALFKQKQYHFTPEIAKSQLLLALDAVQDPGNLGTIIRLADWFGINDIICAAGTADVYNPKVVQATMGALARVRVHYVDLPSTLTEISKFAPIYGTFLEGDTIYDLPLSQHGVIVMGNEGNGISDAVKRLVSDKLFIPNFPIGAKTSESLNVATATAIVLSEFRRRA